METASISCSTANADPSSVPADSFARLRITSVQRTLTGCGWLWAPHAPVKHPASPESDSRGKQLRMPRGREGKVPDVIQCFHLIDLHGKGVSLDSLCFCACHVPDRCHLVRLSVRMLIFLQDWMPLGGRPFLFIFLIPAMLHGDSRGLVHSRCCINAGGMKERNQKDALYFLLRRDSGKRS